MNSTSSSSAGIPSRVARHDRTEAQQLLLWLRRITAGWLVVLSGAIGGALFGWVIGRAPDSYEATAIIEVAPPPGDTSGLFAPAGARNLLGSQAIAARIVDEFELHRPPHNLSAQAFLADAFAVIEIPNTHLFRLRVRLLEPELSALVATRIAEHAVELAARLWRESGQSRRTQLESQLEQARTSLEEAEQRMLSYRERGGLNLLKQEIDGLLARRADPGRRALTDLYSRELELIRLENEVEAKRSVFIDFTARHEHARIENESARSPARLIDQPIVPHQPVPQTGTRTIALGLLAGLLLGVCVTIARNWSDGAAGANGSPSGDQQSFPGNDYSDSALGGRGPETHDEQSFLR